MLESTDELSLKELLKQCTDRSSPQWGKAWRQFIKRYTGYIYKVAYKRCLAWGIKRTGFPLSETVNEIVDYLLEELCRKDFYVLRNFKAYDNETVFKGYLATVTDRIAKRYLRKCIYEKMSLTMSLQLLDKELTQDTQWQLFDHLVSSLRKTAGKQARNVERNILIFTLLHFEDFTTKMLRHQPLFKGLGHRVVHNVINRSKAKLQNCYKV